MTFLAWIYWDPSRVLFTIPYADLPLTWYGLLFGLGFWAALHIFIFMYRYFLAKNPYFEEGEIDWTHLKSFGFLKEIKRGDIDACNRLLKKTDPLFDVSLPFFAKELVTSVEKHYGEERALFLKKRLLLERRYPKLFIPIHKRAKQFAENLLLYVLIGAVLGARLGHVFFYEEPMEYLLNPLLILKTWEGGLASHIGVIGTILGALLFYRKYKKEIENSFLRLLDYIAIPTMFVAVLIRIGNFFNQEILGVPTLRPWGIVFMHPADGSPALPRHPAQLYEALFYLAVFLFTALVWRKKHDSLKAGWFAGFAILASFLFRFFIEFIKTGQSVWFDGGASSFLMGQILSIPLVLFGSFLLFRGYFQRKSADVISVKRK